jgi:prepilin-type processing-associated H-X9-DG protein
MLAGIATGLLVRVGPAFGNPQVMLRGIAEAIGMYDTDGDRAQCLGHVKEIARAVQMYLNDYGKLPPKEERQAASDYFAGLESNIANCQQITSANPYLRWPVVLDEYIKDRSSWDCASARIGVGALWIVPGPDWLRYLKKNQGKWGKTTGVGPCTGAWPSGWGGSITDSVAQGRTAVPGDPPKGTGAFRQGIGYAASYGLTRAEVSDPAWFVVCGDSQMERISSPVALAYPDVCKVGNRMGDDAGGCGADWENCPSTKTCGLSAEARKQFWIDPPMRRRFARHLGGSNIGYLDGHAAWMSAEDILNDSPTSKDTKKGRLRGIKCLCLGQPESGTDSEDETESEGEE